MILFLLLLLFILLIFLLLNKNENFAYDYIPDFISVYNSKLIKYKNTQSKILLIGSVSQYKLDFINNYFNDSIIYVYNEDRIKYKNFDDNIIQNDYNPFTINSIKDFIDTKISFDIIISCGQISIENYLFIAKYYINLLSLDGIILFENIESLEHAILIIDKIPIYIKNRIDIIDLRRINPEKYDKICLFLDKSQ